MIRSGGEGRGTASLKSRCQHADNLTIMSRRPFVSLIALLFTLAACAGSPDTTSTTGTLPDNTTVPSSVPDAVALSYTLASGQVYVFEVDMEGSVEMTSTGDPDAMGEGDLPGEAAFQISGTAVITYEVSDGPEAGTFTVKITGDWSDLVFSGTVDGEPIDEDDPPGFADMDPVDVTIVVDANGRPIQEGSDGFDDLFGGFGAFEDLLSGGFNLGSFFGPPFSDGEVTVGDTWTETVDVPGMGDDVFTTEIRSRVARTESLGGVEVFVIDTVTDTPLIEFDLAEMIIGMFEAFLQFGNPTAEELAEFYEMAEQIRFAFRIEPATTTMTTWFDNEAGITRQLEIDGSVSMAFDLAMPDEDTGEVAAFALELKTTQSVRQRLISGPGA